MEELDDELVGNSKSHLFQWKTVHEISRMLQSADDTQPGEDDQTDDDDTMGYRDVATSLAGLQSEVSTMYLSFQIKTSIVYYGVVHSSIAHGI